MNASPPFALKKLDQWILSVNRSLMITLLGVMSAIIFVSVSIRYLSDYSIPWAEEVSRYLMVWLMFLGIGPVMRLGGHIAIDTFPKTLSGTSAIILRGIIALIIGAFFMTLLWVGWLYMQKTIHQSTAVLEISFAWVSSSVPIGFALALWHGVAVAVPYVKSGTYETSDDLNIDEVGAI